MPDTNDKAAPHPVLPAPIALTPEELPQVAAGTASLLNAASRIIIFGGIRVPTLIAE